MLGGAKEIVGERCVLAGDEKGSVGGGGRQAVRRLDHGENRGRRWWRWREVADRRSGGRTAAAQRTTTTQRSGRGDERWGRWRSPMGQGVAPVRGRTEGAGRPELAGGGASRRWDVEVGDLKKGRRPVEIRWEEKEKIRRKTKKRGVLWTFHHLPCYTARRSFAKHL